ncbi:MAG: RNA polymerase sigma factor [Muribaculaceae bacterium]|nr:RNA polymerase sigma factor [Muribaculaceae bacterium]
MKQNEKEFTELVKTHKRIIYNVCYMFSNDEDEVADLFQESIIKLWTGMKSFEGRSDLKTWIYRIVMNTCITINRREKRKQAEPLDVDVNLFDAEDEDSRQIELLHKRIMLLRPFDRAIVLLWLEDMTYAEIGDIVGISAKNVGMRLFRIREQLKNMK